MSEIVTPLSPELTDELQSAPRAATLYLLTCIACPSGERVAQVIRPHVAKGINNEQAATQDVTLCANCVEKYGKVAEVEIVGWGEPVPFPKIETATVLPFVGQEVK